MSLIFTTDPYSVSIRCLYLDGIYDSFGRRSIGMRSAKIMLFFASPQCQSALGIYTGFSVDLEVESKAPNSSLVESVTRPALG